MLIELIKLIAKKLNNIERVDGFYTFNPFLLLQITLQFFSYFAFAVGAGKLFR